MAAGRGHYVRFCVCPLAVFSFLLRFPAGPQPRLGLPIVFPAGHDLLACSPIQSALEKLPTIGCVLDNACDKQKRLDILPPGV